ncbi:hypothetical protein [Caldicellulosiruptor sp. DIB 104C]|uniref:hypothetical protein n=1 Tax=Caldicellulosiruptor sp. DIB 104C TaxID=3019889 RepID=UPI00230659AF|nr:hypothetical protein [Caldicellulosiruptor sp. DIB 104C]
MKVAIVHEWLTTMGGSEKVILELKKLFPEAPIYTLSQYTFDFLKISRDFFKIRYRNK